MPKSRDEAPICRRCNRRHWNLEGCLQALEAEQRTRTTPIYRPREGFHDPGFGGVSNAASFSHLGKARKEADIG